MTYRRDVIASSVLILLAGCSGSGDDDPSPNDDLPGENDDTSNGDDDPTSDSDPSADNGGTSDGDDSTPEPSDSIHLEYSIGEPRSHEDVPEEIVGHPNPDGFVWFPVTVDIVDGEIDAADFIGLTQLEIDGTSEFARGARAEGAVLEDGNDGPVETDNEVDVFYRADEEDASASTEWVTEQLGNQYSGLEVDR